MSVSIERRAVASEHVLTDDLATTSVIDFQDAAAGYIGLPASYGGVSAAVYHCDTEDGTYLAVRDRNGSDVSVSLPASRWVQLPAGEMFPGMFFKLVLNTDDSKPVKIVFKG